MGRFALVGLCFHVLRDCMKNELAFSHTNRRLSRFTGFPGDKSFAFYLARAPQLYGRVQSRQARRQSKPERAENSKDLNSTCKFIVSLRILVLHYANTKYTQCEKRFKSFVSSLTKKKLLLKIVSRLRRIAEIQKLLVHQLTIIETMTSLDFLVKSLLLFT